MPRLPLRLDGDEGFPVQIFVEISRHNSLEVQRAGASHDDDHKNQTRIYLQSRETLNPTI